MTTQTVAARTIELIQSGKSNEDVLAGIQLTHPGRGTKKTVAWYRSHLKHDVKKRIFIEARAKGPDAVALETRLNAEIFGVDMERVLKGDAADLI